MPTIAEESAERRIDALVERGEERGCVNLSELMELVQELELPEDEAQSLQERLEARGIEVADDCGNGAQPGPAYNHDELVLMTSDTLQLFLRDVRRHPLLSAEEEVELAQRIERGDLDAKERLVNSNLRLVVSIARRYQGFGLPLQDLVQEAMLGLIRAETELTARLDREPTEEELAAHSKFSVDEVAALHDLTRVTTSLDVQVGDSETTLGELRADEAPAPEEEVVDRQREQAIAKALESLPEPERKVLELRFGTGGEPEATLRDIGRRLGISQSRARQLEAQGLDRLAAAGS